MKMKLLIVIGTICLLGCSETKKEKEIVKDKEVVNKLPSEDFKIEILVDSISKNKYKTKVKTNFPDNTSFTVSATREYFRKNNKELYSGQYYYEFSSIVKNGELNFEFSTDDNKWIDDYEKLQIANQKFSKDLTDIDFKTIKDSVEISVLYTPKSEKNEKNIELIGINGEKLKGDGVEKVADFYVFSKKINVFNKFSK